MVQAAVRQASYDEIISCPAFRAGYADHWREREPTAGSSWSDAERLSYKRGYQFGDFVVMHEGRYVPLSAGRLPNSLALTLLFMAFRSGAVQ